MVQSHIELPEEEAMEMLTQRHSTYSVDQLYYNPALCMFLDPYFTEFSACSISTQFSSQ